MSGTAHIIRFHTHVLISTVKMRDNLIQHGRFYLSLQVVGGKMTEAGRLGAFITKVKKGSLADVVGHLRAGTNHFHQLTHVHLTTASAETCSCRCLWGF